MDAFIHSFRKNLKFVLLSGAVILCCLMISSVLISIGTISEESMEPLIIVSVFLAAFFGAFLTVRKSGAPMHGFLHGGLLLGLIIISSFFVCGLGGLNAAMIKRIISIFSGTIVGNLLGRRQHYKLRNSRKRRRITTK